MLKNKTLMCAMKQVSLLCIQMLPGTNVKNEVYKTIIGDVVAHLKPQNSPFRQICNVLHHHYSFINVIVIVLLRFTK